MGFWCKTVLSYRMCHHFHSPWGGNALQNNLNCPTTTLQNLIDEETTANNMWTSSDSLKKNHNVRDVLKHSKMTWCVTYIRLFYNIRRVRCQIVELQTKHWRNNQDEPKWLLDQLSDWEEPRCGQRISRVNVFSHSLPVESRTALWCRWKWTDRLRLAYSWLLTFPWVATSSI